MTSVLVRGGTVVTEEATLRASILIRDDIVERVLSADETVVADEIVDASGKLVMPGGVDLHCHFREPDPQSREGFDTGSAGAVAGGITTVVEMPQAVPPATTYAGFMAKRERASAKSYADFALWAGVTGDTLGELRPMHDAGAAAFKAYMIAGSPVLPRVDDGHLFEAMRIIATWDGVIAVHAENEELNAFLTAKLRGSGRVDPGAFVEARPILGECEAIRRAGHFATATGCRLHILHASSGTSVNAVADLRRVGCRATVETCPHYLLLSEDDLKSLGPYAKGTPPVRSRQEVDALWGAIGEGKVDILASDHSPTNQSEKDRGQYDIFEASNGLVGNETMLQLVLNEAVYGRGLTPSIIARMSATNPAKLIGIYPRKGTLRAGSDADLAIYDLDRPWHVDKERLHGRQKWTPYHGRQSRVALETVLLRGTKVFEHGAILTSPGFGKFVRPERESGR